MVFSHSGPVRAYQRVEESARPTEVRYPIAQSLALTSKPPREMGDQLPLLRHPELSVLRRGALPGLSFDHSIVFEKFVVAPTRTVRARLRMVDELSDLPIS